MGRDRFRELDELAHGDDERLTEIDVKARMVYALKALNFHDGRPVLTGRQFDVLWRVYVRGISQRECARQDHCARRSIQLAYSGAWSEIRRYRGELAGQ